MSTIAQTPGLLKAIRDRFAHVDYCPLEEKSRVFFENAGGALTLKRVGEISAHYATIPDNQGRANEASKALVNVINKARADAAILLNAKSGQIFVGESGTELLFRMIRNAVLSAKPEGNVVGSTLEHPATRSAAKRWAGVAKVPHHLAIHNDDTGTVTVADYDRVVTPWTTVATIIHTSPVTGMSVDVKAIAAFIRSRAPECMIIVDGIQHAAHGDLDIDAYDIDGYAISPYKVFSRHGYGIGWISDKLTMRAHDELDNGPAGNWELGTRDTGAYATFSAVVEYFEWLGSQFEPDGSRRQKIIAAGKAIKAQEHALTHAMLHGADNCPGLIDMPDINVIGGIDNPHREGLVALTHDNISAAELVEHLNQRGIRTHVRKADHYSGNILDPLGLDSCVRVSMCHYNSIDEVKQFLVALNELQ